MAGEFLQGFDRFEMPRGEYHSLMVLADLENISHA
jgi:hypothetical protein